MGHLNDHDPANTRAITRSRLGLARENQRFRTGHYPHPGRRYAWVPTMDTHYGNEQFCYIRQL